MNETRKHERFPATLPIKCVQEGQPGSTEVLIDNISCGGAALLMEDILSTGTKLELDFSSIGYEEPVKAEVVWATQKDGSGATTCICGVQFIVHYRHAHANLVELVCEIESYRIRERDLNNRELTGSEAAKEWLEIRSEE